MDKLLRKLSSFAQHLAHGPDNGNDSPDGEHDGDQSLPAPTRSWLDSLTCSRLRTVDIYTTALTHRSVVNDHPGTRDSNQRLEFLGDAVLDLVISEHLYRTFPESDEGKLSSNRSKIVNRKSLASFAARIALGQHLLVGESADEKKIRSSESALADAFESLVGAVYLDLGLSATREFIERHIVAHLDLRRLDAIEHNHKSRLIEYAQSHQIEPPVYTVIAEEGAEHEKTFTVEVSFEGAPLGRGTAGRKKDAEQLAARTALSVLENKADD
ncbi:ribonuclease III [Prosthecochloris sp. GSB1]|uniref:ribonuclease III n=1 Tax=Prosthecochloris sp. GSB1 TaxID=281093 RepID=UPI000B8CA5B7|nr:ribonuclease III [Prosthecochloris sp. GSB1]ASQ89660.1 ribonuclease III [Prosthecochloris sp. GSB1]